MTNDSNARTASSDLTFIMNEAGQSLRGRFAILLGKDTRFFDCLVGYFFISGFHRLYPALENVEKVLPRPTTKKVAEAMKREIESLKVLGILRRDISPLFFQSTRAQQMHHSLMPREVILSSWAVAETRDKEGGV